MNPGRTGRSRLHAGAAARRSDGTVASDTDRADRRRVPRDGRPCSCRGGPPPHIHPYTDEGSCIADGEMTFVFGDREVVAGPGSFVFVPRGVEHTAYITKRSAAC